LFGIANVTENAENALGLMWPGLHELPLYTTARVWKCGTLNHAKLNHSCSNVQRLI